MSNSDSHLVREMRETAEVIRRIDTARIAELSQRITRSRVLFTGEGSSRILPSKKARYDSLRYGYAEILESEGATQAIEYNLHRHTILAASNSGRTKEVVRLLRTLRGRGHDEILLLTAGSDTPAEAAADYTYRLISGKEEAVAATKTVLEQALVYDLAFRMKNGKPLPDLATLASLFEQALEMDIPDWVSERIASAGTVYWAGRNDGVGEELTLKTNEITRKPADFLEGTYAVHGIEEVMSSNDVVIVLQPFEEEEQKFREVLIDGVGLSVIAITSRPTGLEALIIPENGDFAPYVELAAGWNLLVAVGTRLGIDLDKPARARKVGNELPDS